MRVKPGPHRIRENICEQLPLREIHRLAALCAAVVLLSACENKPSAIFDGPATTWDIRARKLPLSERYTAFRYGVSEMHPPVILDDPMADGGKAAADLILDRNRREPDDYLLLASVHVYDRMKTRSVWNICGTPEYGQAIGQANLIDDPDYRVRYAKYLIQICSPNDSSTPTPVR